MSIQNIKRELKDDIPILGPTRDISDLLSVLFNKDIQYNSSLHQADRMYNCQSLYFKDPQQCKFILNLKTGKSEEIKGESIEIQNMQNISIVPYLLNNNNYFPPIKTVYKIHFTNDRVKREIEYKYYPEIIKNIYKYSKNPVILDGSCYEGCNLISLCSLEKNIIGIGCEENQIYYNGMINNWKLFGLQNSHQFIKKSYSNILSNISQGKDLLFTPNILYLEDQIQILESPYRNIFDLIILKLSSNNRSVDIDKYIKLPVNNNQYLLFIGKEDLSGVNLQKEPQNIDQIYSEELKRRELYNNIKSKLGEIVKPYKKLEAPKFLLRYVFSLIIKRTDKDDPIFIQNFDYGKLVIEGDAKYFNLPLEVTDKITKLLIDEFSSAALDMKKFSQNPENFQKSKLSISEIIKLRYDYLELSTMGLAYPYANEGYKRDDDVLECFSNPINRYFENFCTAFPDLEKYVGSKGSFWSLQDFPYKRLILNPPFDETLIIQMFQKIMSILKGGRLPQEVEIIIPYWKDMKEIIAFEKSTIKIPHYRYKTRVIRKKDIYFIDYSKTPPTKIYPCDIFMINIYGEDSGTHKLLTSTVNTDDDFYILSFSPFKQESIDKSKNLPETFKDSRRLIITCEDLNIKDIAEILEKFLSNYGDAITHMIYKSSESRIYLDVFTPHYEKFIQALAVSGIYKYCKTKDTQGLKIQVGETIEYLDIKTGDNSLSDFYIKVDRGELSVIPPSKEMKLMEPIFLFNF